MPTAMHKSVYEKMKLGFAVVPKFKKLVGNYFASDLDIEFELLGGRRKLLCKFENDAWYDHADSHRRHNGERRRFIVISGNDSLFEEVDGFTGKLYTKEELLDLVDEFANRYNLKPC